MSALASVPRPRAASLSDDCLCSRDGGGDARRHVLVVTPELPSPPTWGFALRVHHLARGLARRHHVSLLAHGVPGGPEEVEGVFHRVHLVPPLERNRRARQLTSLASPAPFHLSGHRSRAMQAALERLVGMGGVDVVQIESSQMSWLRVPPGPVVVLDEHNIESTLLRQVARVESSPLRRAFGELEHAKMRRVETTAWRRADGCAVTSELDALTLRFRVPETPICVVPNGVDFDALVPSADEAVEADSLVFVGAMNYRPNADGVAHFVRDVLPRVQRERPSAAITVVGQGVTPELRRLSGPSVRFTGSVPDVRPYLARAAAVVIPLRVGGGTRLKLLEALAMGKAVVTTTRGAFGIEVTDGRELLVADGAGPLAEAVVRVLRDGRLRAALGREGRALVERSYGWEAAAERLGSFHARLVETAQHMERG